MEITGSIALVTGGASGLGSAVVKVLVEKGAKVAIIDKNEAAARDIAKGYQTLDQSLIFSCDVTDANAVSQVFQTIKQKLGIPRIIVNCAGIVAAERVVSAANLPHSLSNFEKVIQVNLIGTFNVLRMAAAAMMALPLQGEERGVIINTASIAAFEGQIGQAAYAASKGAVASMTLPLARELAVSQIRVMAIAPGLFETPMLKEIPEKARTRLLESSLFPKRLGQPEEFAKLVQAIIENPMLNGSIIRLDGGVHLA